MFDAYVIIHFPKFSTNVNPFLKKNRAETDLKKRWPENLYLFSYVQRLSQFNLMQLVSVGFDLTAQIFLRLTRELFRDFFSFADDFSCVCVDLLVTRTFYLPSQ